MSRSAVFEALETLGAFHLVQQQGGRWAVVAATDLTALAEQFGVHQLIALRLARHRDERLTHRRLLQIAAPRPTIGATVADWYANLPPPPAPDNTETALEVLQWTLGAYPIPA